MSAQGFWVVGTNFLSVKVLMIYTVFILGTNFISFHIVERKRAFTAEWNYPLAEIIIK